MVDKICTVEGCPIQVYARGWCRKHYARWWRCGNPLGLFHHDSDGRSKRPEYHVWKGMVSRYRHSGPGQDVCNRWLDDSDGFPNFLADMGLRPSLEYCLDRIDLDRGYCPENCRWLTRVEHSRRCNRLVPHYEEIHDLCASGEYTQRQVAKMFDTSEWVICRLLKKWREAV